MLKVSPRIMEYAAASYQFHEVTKTPGATHIVVGKARSVLISAEAKLTQHDRDLLNSWL
jgi:hypothetical protein